MKQYISIILFIIIFVSCRPSARFSASTERDEGYAVLNERATRENSSLNNFVRQWLDTPYKYGGMSKAGVDCSGFSSIVMREIYGIMVPRTADEQYQMGKRIRDNWRAPGDLVFFINFRGQGIDHVGIFLGNNQFAHAAESTGVTISNLDERYYRNRYVGACRYTR